MTINDINQNYYKDRVIASMAFNNISLDFIKELRQIHGLSYQEIYVLIKEALLV